MNQVICSNCFEVEDTTKRFIELPYVCALCETDSTLAINQDATTYYIIQARSKSSNRVEDWFRSENPDTKGIFDDYSTALEAADREQDGSEVEYRIVEYRPESTLNKVPYFPYFGMPCQSAIDSVQTEYLDPYCVGETNPRVYAMHSDDTLNQFDEDTELISGLMVENDDLKMQLSQANLNIQIQGERIADLENTVDAYRVIFRIPGVSVGAISGNPATGPCPAPTIPPEVWEALSQADGYAERESGTLSALPENVTWIGEIDGKRYRGLGNPKSGPLSHLPEGSH